MILDSADTLNKRFLKLKKSIVLQKLLFARIKLNRLMQTVYLIIHSPNLIKFIFSVMHKVWIRNERRLRSLELGITYKCNSRCRQCSCRLDFNEDKEKEKRLSIDEYKDVINQAIDMGAFQFCINGGEPLLDKDLVVELTRYVSNKGYYVHLCTNGILLDEELVIKLKNAGLNSVEFGLDGPTQEVHDQNRVTGSFKKIFENVKYANKHGVLVILNTILSNDSCMSEEIYKIIELAVNNKTLLQITPCCLTGAFKNRTDLILNDETKLFFYYLLSLSFRCRSDLYSSLTKIKCPAAVEKIGIQPYGDVVSCPLIQIKYGNIRQNSLMNIQLNMLNNPYYGRSELYGCLPSMNENFIRDYLLDGK